MKKIYEKPMIEIETYVLSAAIAAGCSSIVSMGPEAPGYKACGEYDTGFGGFSARSGARDSGGNPFYSDDGIAGCDCYYTAGGSILLTS